MWHIGDEEPTSIFDAATRICDPCYTERKQQQQQQLEKELALIMSKEENVPKEAMLRLLQPDWFKPSRPLSEYKSKFSDQTT